MQAARISRIGLFVLAAVGVALLISSIVLSDSEPHWPLRIDLAAQRFIPAALIVLLAGFWVRSWKQQYILRQIRPVRTTPVFEGEMIGFLFNVILPLRAGELLRAHYIGRAISISRSAVFATIIIERGLDSAVLLLVGTALFLLTGIPSVSAIWVLGWLLVLTLFVAFLLVSARRQSRWLLRAIYWFSRLFNDRIRDRVRMVSWSIIYTLRNVFTRKRTYRYIAATVGMWVLYLGAATIVVIGIFPGLGLGDIAKTAAASQFGVAVPSGPAYLGSFSEAFLATSGLDPEFVESVDGVFAMWLFAVVPVTVLGLVYLSIRRFTPARSDGDQLVSLQNKLYRDTDITHEFSAYLESYFHGDQITRVLADLEFHGRSQVLRSFKGGSNALTVLAQDNGTVVVKKVTLPQYASKLKDQYTWLLEFRDLQQVADVVGDFQITPDHVELNIEYRPEYVTYFTYIHSHAAFESIEVLQRVWSFMSENVYADQREVLDPEGVLREYIDQKILAKAHDAARSSFVIEELVRFRKIRVNGEEFDNLAAVLERIMSMPVAWHDLQQFRESVIHGDLTVDNLMVDPATSDFLILDPNNENAISDPVVDAGKLMQSFDSGYEFLIDLKRADVVDNSIHFEEERSAQYAELQSALDTILRRTLSPAQYRAVLFHEAVHYFRMLTYRVNINPESAPAFYGVGVRLLNRFIRQY